MRKPGRPTKYTREIADAICDVLRRGGTYRLAAQAVGISDMTLERWRATKPAFAAAVERAAAEGALRALHTIITAAERGDWRAAAWLLEHRYPQEYGRGALDLARGGAITIHIVDATAPLPADAVEDALGSP